MYKATTGGGAPPSVKRSIFTISNFQGADLTSSETSMSAGRSPNCPNMIRSEPGKVRKRMGYHLKQAYPGRINGGAVRRDEQGNEVEYVHAGNSLYADGEIIAGTKEAALSHFGEGVPIGDSGLSDNRSCWLFVSDTTAILDGEHLRALKSSTHVDSGSQVRYCPKMSDIAYTPTIMISRDPEGGGTAFEEVNVLSDAWTETFFGTNDATEYQMSLDSLSDAPVKVQVLDADGVTWVDKAEGTDFTVDRPSGVITFTTAPGAPIEGTGADNVRITASKDRSEARSRIDNCTFGIVYGNGTAQRLFVSGNPDYPNRDFWSAINDPTYFPDINYANLGSTHGSIVGYSKLGGTLATHKSDGTIYVRSAYTDDDGFQQFLISNTIHGARSIAPYSCQQLNNEPMFLTERGIYAITTAELTEEKYAQVRSHYLNGALLKELLLGDAYACIFNDFYMLAVGTRIYILDGSTKAYAPEEPHSSFQYEAFYFEMGRNVRVLWEQGGMLLWGDNDGNLFEFYTDDKSPASYSDNGVAITAMWQTAALDGSLFYKNKSFKRCAIQLGSYSVTGVAATVRKRGVWTQLFSNYNSARYLDFGAVDFAHFTFSVDSADKTLGSKIKVKKVDKAVFRFTNDQPNMPFKISEIAFEYTESGNYKG